MPAPSGRFFLSFLALLPSGAPAGETAQSLPEFRGSYGSSIAEHERLGLDLGTAFAAEARRRLARARNAALIGWSTTDPEGVRTLAIFAEAHERLYPRSMAELRGIAAGVGVSFAHIFALNIHQELAHFAPNRSALAPPAMRCSDYSLWPWVAHNEDSGLEEAGTLALAHVRIDGSDFTAALYAGDLPSGAFGFNAHGVGFSLNMVDPLDAVLGGAGRGFVSRELLRARSLREAVAVASADGQSVGHSYQLLAVGPGPGSGGEVVQLESVARGRHSATAVRPGGPALFHANHLRFLSVAQRTSLSSRHRLERALALRAPTSAAELLAVLGDQHDRRFPIFHDARSRAAGDVSGETTLASVLFDVRNASLTVYAGSPALGRVAMVLPIPRPPSPAAVR